MVEAIALRVEAIASRLEAIPISLDAIAIRLEAIPANPVWFERPSELGGLVHSNRATYRGVW